MGIASCIVDLPNIDLIATGSYKKRIELWVLRTQNNTPANLNAIEEKAMSKSKASSLKDKSKTKKAQNEKYIMEIENDIS